MSSPACLASDENGENNSDCPNENIDLKGVASSPARLALAHRPALTPLTTILQNAGRSPFMEKCRKTLDGVLPEHLADATALTNDDFAEAGIGSLHRGPIRKCAQSFLSSTSSSGASSATTGDKVIHQSPSVLELCEAELVNDKIPLGADALSELKQAESENCASNSRDELHSDQVSFLLRKALQRLESSGVSLNEAVATGKQAAAEFGLSPPKSDDEETEDESLAQSLEELRAGALEEQSNNRAVSTLNKCSAFETWHNNHLAQTDFRTDSTGQTP